MLVLLDACGGEQGDAQGAETAQGRLAGRLGCGLETVLGGGDGGNPRVVLVGGEMDVEGRGVVCFQLQGAKLMGTLQVGGCPRGLRLPQQPNVVEREGTAVYFETDSVVGEGVERCGAGARLGHEEKVAEEEDEETSSTA